jgi:predicted permease
MSVWSRIANVFRGDRLNREIDEELQSHINEAIELGRDPAEIRRAFGPALRAREQSRDVKLAARLESLRADVVFGWRQIVKNRTASGAAIISLALAIGACTAAFRLIDALLLRPLPVSHPERLYFLTYEFRTPDGKTDTGDSFDYPGFRTLRAAVKDEAELMAIAYSGRTDLTYGSDDDLEKAYRQYVSGWMFDTFGLKAAAGRLLKAADDVKPGAHPYAVLSYDYWSRRFGRDPKAVGRTFRLGNDLVEIVGVVERGFTGTETGTVTDIFLPNTMNARAIEEQNWNWFRTWVHLRPGANPERVRQKLHATLLASRREQVKAWNASTPRERIDDYVNSPLFLEPAAAGVSGMQKTYRRSLAILAVLVGLVLLIACANVANLMTAQAASREREMALRVSIGAGRGRLVQLVLVESTLIALLASAIGGLFAAWAAPFVVSMINPPDNPARLILPADWRVLGFAVALSLGVAFLFGLVPALRASAVKPVSALKGGEDPHARRRLMNALVAAQVAFCFLVHFVAGLFVSTFDRLSNQATGFTAERLLVLEVVAKGEQPIAHWDQLARHLRSVSGVQSAAICRWALMSGSGWSSDIWVNGRAPDGRTNPYYLGVSSEWLSTMKIPLLNGRDIRDGEAFPQVAIVNEAFARRYFNGQDPVGKTVEKMEGRDRRVTMSIIGYVRDARYRNMREEIRPTLYVPFPSQDAKGVVRGATHGTIIVRTSTDDPFSLAPMLRREVSRARSEFRVSNVRTQEELVRSHTVRERMLAMLSMFFAVVALLLAAVGLYGVLDFSVLQRRREIGIRLALGAPAERIVRRVTAEVFSMLLLGAGAGLALGVASEQYVETLLYQVKATDFRMLAVPVVTIVLAALFASLPPVIRAVRIDPASMLRAE